MFLIFDTETTGLPRNYNAPLTDFDNWPRVVQLAWQLHDDKGNLLHHDSIIIKPAGFTIPFNAEQVHGISTQRALNEGIELKTVLEQFITVVKQCRYLCGHNIEFDLNIIGAEFLRMGFPNHFEGYGVIDTKCDQTTEFCAIPGGKGGKFKWPTLTELYTKLFNETFDEAHNAAFDVLATSRVFFETVKRGIIKIREITDHSILEYQAPDLSALLAHELKLKAEKQKTSSNLSPNAEHHTPNPISGIQLASHNFFASS